MGGSIMRSSKLFRLCLLIAIGSLVWACTEKPRIIEQKCSLCHSSYYVYQQKRTMNEWDRLLNGMKTRGLKLTPDEEKTIRNILSKDYSVN
jgi:hypothetical protein